MLAEVLCQWCSTIVKGPQWLWWGSWKLDRDFSIAATHARWLARKFFGSAVLAGFFHLSNDHIVIFIRQSVNHPDSLHGWLWLLEGGYDEVADRHTQGSFH